MEISDITWTIARDPSRLYEWRIMGEAKIKDTTYVAWEYAEYIEGDPDLPEDVIDHHKQSILYGFRHTLERESQC